MTTAVSRNQAKSEVVEGRTEKRTGGCHCGNIRYEVDLDLSKGAGRRADRCDG